MTAPTGVPHGWTTATVGDLLLRIETGKSPRCDPRPAAADERGVIKVSAMTYGNFDAEEHKALLPGSDFDPDHEIRGGDLLFSRANTAAYVGAVVVVPQNVRPGLLLSDKSLRLVPAPGVHPKWLLYALRSEGARRQIEAVATGTKDSMRNISQEKVRAITLTIPPAGEQDRIVAALEEHQSRVDAAAKAARLLHARVMRLRDAARNAVVRQALEATGGRTRSTGEVADVQGGIQKQPARHAVENDGVPFLRVANVGRATLDLSEVHHILLKPAELPRVLLRKGDLLVVEGNGSPDQIGRAATWDGSIDPCTHQNHLIRVRPGADLVPEYLELVWNAPTTLAQLKAVASSTSGLYTLSTGKVKSVQLPLPETAHQLKIVAAAQSALAAVQQSVPALVGLERRIDRLRTALLSAACSGALTDRSADDEPAELLLKRIAEDRSAAPPPAARRRRARTVLTARQDMAVELAEESA